MAGLKVSRHLSVNVETALGRAVRSRNISGFDNNGRCSKVSYVAPLSEDIDLK
jgi:hypothetical protein